MNTWLIFGSGSGGIVASWIASRAYYKIRALGRKAEQLVELCQATLQHRVEVDRQADISRRVFRLGQSSKR